MLNGGGEPAWIEVENNGGEAELAHYRLRVQPANGNGANVWQGGEEEVLWGLGTLRLTDGSQQAVPAAALGEPRMVIAVNGLDLSGTPGGSLTLFWTDGDGNVQEDTVTVAAGSPAGVPLYRIENQLTAPNRGH
jgi:hypothetical protein